MDPIVPGAYSARSLASEHVSALRSLLDYVDFDAVERVTEKLRRARDRKSTIFVAGNGGSAATASHWVNDLGKATKRSGRLPMRVHGLSDNIPWLSALANDEGYERIFVGQMENFAERDDILMVLSASGNSPNLVKVVEHARRAGVTAIALLGFDGGRLKELVDDVIWIQTEKGAYELVEDVHSVICHAITRSLIADRPENG